MKRTDTFSVQAGVLAAFIVVAGGPALAQEAGIKTLDGKARTSGKVMTREELRACMKQQDELATQRVTLDGRQAKLTADRENIQKETEAIKAVQASLSANKGEVDALNEKMKAFSAKIADWRARSEEFERGGTSGPSADRQRRTLAKEMTELKTEEAALNAERERVSKTAEQSVDALNVRVVAQQQSAEAWNASSKQLAQDQQAYENSRAEWRTFCADRRYREDDEKAIKAGK